MEKLVSRSLMLILIGMATAQNIQAGERMSMPTSFKKQTTGLSHVSQQTISVKGKCQRPVRRTNGRSQCYCRRDYHRNHDRQ